MSTLSEDIWQHILLHVPLSYRFGSCSRVNKTLHRAAAAATQQIELDLGEAGLQRVPGLYQWMLHHGQHLTSLRLGASGARPGGTLTELPSPNLCELDLRNTEVQLSASSTQPGVLHSCARLTKLVLIDCPLSDGHSSLSALSAPVGLQHLNLTMYCFQPIVSRSTDDSFTTSTVLQHLTQLKHFSLQEAHKWLGINLQHVSCLVNLQELHIDDSFAPPRPDTTPGLSRLTTLRQLSLDSVTIDPSILQDCTQLQGLELYNLEISSASGAAALLSLLGRLQQLQTLQLFWLECDWPATAAAYSSLTASSQLHTLELPVDDLPPGVWQYVFQPDRPLPALQHMRLQWLYSDPPRPPPPAALGFDDISRMVSCCPGLHEVKLHVQPGTPLADLGKASGLTSLFVAVWDGEGFESLRAISGLVTLQELRIERKGPITPNNLLCLTALTGLTRLRINPGMLAESEGAVDVDMPAEDIESNQDCRTGLQSGTPVWLQLLEHCGRYSECQPLIFSSMGRQVALQQQRHTQQEQQLAAQQQQIAELQEQLATTRAQAAAEAAAATAAAAEAGELRRRLQAVEGAEGTGAAAAP